MSWRNVLLVYRKELKDSLRDRRTLISMIVVPLLAIPLLTSMAGMMAAHTLRQAATEVPRIMALGGEDSPKVMASLRAAKTLILVPPATDFTNQIIDKRIRAAVVIPRDFDNTVARGETAQVTIYNFAGEMKSGVASINLNAFFENLRNTTLVERLRAHDLPPQLLRPFNVVQTNVAPPAKVGGNALGGLIPYVILVFCMIGALYPATDLTAGEKERGTMETLLCSPVPRTDLVLGKFLMVLMASLATVLLSMMSLGATFEIGKRALQPFLAKAGALKFAMDPAGLAGILLLLMPAAALLSAVLLAISLYARSFREAQSYTGPMMFVVVVPALAALLPGLELNAPLALVPLMNVSLACKELAAGTWHWGYLGLIFVSSFVYAGLALSWAVWLFNREKVLFRM